MVFLHEDPDQAWAELGEHYLWEARVYSGGATAGRIPSCTAPRPPKACEPSTTSRPPGRYRFMTPQQLIADVEENPNDHIVLHPLVGAMPIEAAWKSVQLLTDEVLPTLK